MDVNVKVGNNARLITWDMKEAVPLVKILHAAEEMGGAAELKTAWIVFADEGDGIFMVISTVEMPWVDACKLCSQFSAEGVEEPEVAVYVITGGE